MDHTGQRKNMIVRHGAEKGLVTAVFDLDGTEEWLAQNEIEADDEAWELARHRAAVEHGLAKTALSEQSRRIYRELMETGESCAAVARRLKLPAATVRQVKSRVTRMIAAFKKTT